MKKAASPPAAVQALSLLGKWTRLAQGHVALAAGCSCGVGVTSLRVQDFERDILDFLQGKHGELAQAPSVADLLRELARPGGGKAAALVLADLERTIDSFEQQHSGR